MAKNKNGGMPPKKRERSSEEMKEDEIKPVRKGRKTSGERMDVEVMVRRSQREKKAPTVIAPEAPRETRKIVRASKSKRPATMQPIVEARPMLPAPQLVLQHLPVEVLRGINMTAIREKRQSRSSSSRSSSEKRLELFPQRLSPAEDVARSAVIDREVDKLIEKTNDVLHIEEDYQRMLDLPRIYRNPNYIERYKILKSMLKDKVKKDIASIMQFKDEIDILHKTITDTDLSKLENIQKMVKTLKEAGISQKTLKDISKMVEKSEPGGADFTYNFIKEDLQKLYTAELKIWGDIFHRFSMDRSGHFNAHLESKGKEREGHLKQVAYFDKRLEDISDIIHKIRDDRYETFGEMEYLYEAEPEEERGGDPLKGSLNIMAACNYHMYAEEFLLAYENAIDSMKEMVTEKNKNISSLDDLFKLFSL